MLSYSLHTLKITAALITNFPLKSKATEVIKKKKTYTQTTLGFLHKLSEGLVPVRHSK